MREEIASIVLGEIDVLIKRLETLDVKLNQELPAKIESVSGDLLEQRLLLKIRFDLQNLSQELSQEYSQQLTQAFQKSLIQQYDAIKTWDHEVLACLKLTRRNYAYLFVLASMAGAVGASLILFLYLVFK